MNKIPECDGRRVSIYLRNRHLSTFRAVNAHSQGGERPLSFVMEFNAAEIEWYETHVRMMKLLEEIERGLSR